MSQGFERATDRKVRSHLKVCRTTVEEYDEQLLTNICQLQVSKDYAAQWETCKAIAIGRIRVEVAKRSISNERHSILEDSSGSEMSILAATQTSWHMPQVSGTEQVFPQCALGLTSSLFL